jgi:hypothetical protein
MIPEHRIRLVGLWNNVRVQGSDKWIDESRSHVLALSICVTNHSSIRFRGHFYAI